MTPLASVDVAVSGLRSAKGVIRLCLTSEPGDFPDCRNGSRAIKRTIPANAPHVRIEGISPGSYAIAVIHDENGNAKLDTALGIPREGFGFSRNPGIGFGPPRFSRAEFSVGTGAETQQVKLRYLL